MTTILANLGPGTAAVPVHDYWLEHRRAMLAELSIQREEMLSHVANTQRSAFLGIDLLEQKLERSIQDLRSDARTMLTDIQCKLADGWRHIAAQREHLAGIQMALDEENEKLVAKAKVRHLQESEQEAFLIRRRNDVEEWSRNVQKQIMTQEQDLSAKSRAIERDMAVLMQAKQKDLQKGGKHVHNFAKITFAESNKLESGGVPRVVTGQPVHLTFNVTPHQALVGMPAICTYLDGKGGNVQGHIVGVVSKKGQIKFDNLIVQGKPGTSHVLLISIPRMAAGTVESAELPVHLMTQPDVRASGYWVMKERKLSARIKVAGVETFGLLGTVINVSLNICGLTFTATATANETNEFPFDISLSNTKINWEDIADAKAMIETQVPLTRYTTAFFHRFEVKIHSEAFPSFQYPPRDFSIDCGISAAPLTIPFNELITETALNDNGRMMATSDVAGTVRIFMTPDGVQWQCRHTIKHQSFVSKIVWGCGGSAIALLEPRQRKIHVWTMGELAKHDDFIDMAQKPKPTSEFGDIPNASLMCLLQNNEIMFVTNGAVVTATTNRNGTTSMSELLPANPHAVTLLGHTIIQSLGNLALIGYNNGSVTLYGLNTRKHIFTAQVETKDPVVSFQVVEEGKILVATVSSVSLLSMHPSWGIITSSFRTPSPIICICTPMPHLLKRPSQWAIKKSSDEAGVDAEGNSTLVGVGTARIGPLRVLITHSDGNLCVLDIETDHVLGYGLLKGVTQPLTCTQAIALDQEEFRLLGCRSLNPVGWGIKLTPRAEANRRYQTRDATFNPPLEGIPAQGLAPLLPTTSNASPDAAAVKSGSQDHKYLDPLDGSKKEEEESKEPSPVGTAASPTTSKKGASPTGTAVSKGASPQNARSSVGRFSGKASPDNTNNKPPAATTSRSSVTGGVRRSSSVNTREGAEPGSRSTSKSSIATAEGPVVKGRLSTSRTGRR